MNRGLTYIIGIIIVIAIVVIAYKALAPSVSAPITVVPSAANNTVMVQLTDPPAVPNGTQALMLYYSNIELHNAGKSNSTGFISLNASGSVNLMSLTNLTQTIGVGKVNKSANFDLLRLNISSATITIDNTTYNVSVPNNRLLVRLSSLMNTTSPTAIVDFYPSVLQIYASNQTIFVLVPSLKGVVIRGLPLNSTQAHVGVKARIENSARAEMDRLRPNITITNSILDVHNTSVGFTVTVKDNSNSSVTMKDIMLSGYMRWLGPIAMPIIRGMPTSVDTSGNGIRANTKSNTSVDTESNGTSANTVIEGNASSGFNLGSLGSLLGSMNINGINLSNMSGMLSDLGDMLSEHGMNISDMHGFNFGIGNLSNSTLKHLGEILNSRMNASVLEDMHNLNISNVSVRDMLREVNNFSNNYHNVLNFVVMSNGTLSLPFNSAEFEDGQSRGQNGYNISAGSSVTFSFNGTVGFGNSPFHVLPLVNQTYSIRAIGEDGARASANVTAG
ncbi:hypothetical protein B2A_04068 [mine drainage metagenome]|uniref:DUF4382 domain-containing protein n=1 Tax=mine drainage metagenome TaxID=410659 RepID=T1C1Q6_9ZZZZ